MNEANNQQQSAYDRGAEKLQEVYAGAVEAIPEGVIVIPLPYDRAWQKSGEKPEVGLQFAGGTDAFFRGWLADHLGSLFTTPDALLDHRRLVRVPCQMDGTARVDEQDFPCAFIDLSLGGVSFIVPREG